MIKIKPRNIAINIKLIIYLYNEPETQQQSWTKRVCKPWPLVVLCPDNCFSPSSLYAIFRNSDWLWHKFWHILRLWL